MKRTAAATAVCAFLLVSSSFGRHSRSTTSFRTAVDARLPCSFIKEIDTGGAFVVAEDTTKAAGQRPSGRISRRAKAAQQREGRAVAEPLSRDTSRAYLDSLRALPRDSSARLAQFHHVRRDVPMIDLNHGKTHPLYISDPVTVVYRDLLDSTRWTYHIRRLAAGVDTRVPLDLSLEDYARLRLERTIRQNWESLAQFYQFGTEQKAGLGELFGKVTNIQIPVPKNPLFSIFGPNIIRLQINGGVDIHAAFRNTKSDLFNNSPLGQTRNEPDFNQEVQVNVKGEIGDKLKIDADWNTQRTFEYENQLKVRYTGYEDEIVQSVEAGNVSLATTSSFITPSAALFGIKAGFQFGPLRLTTVASQKKGQIKELTVSGGARPTPFERRPTDYSRDHYFIDTSYFALYENIFLKIPAVPDPRRQIRDIEVWVSRTGQPLPTDRDVAAYLNEDTVRLKQNDDAIRLGNINPQEGAIEVGRFFKLEQDIDYSYNANAGIISLNKPLEPQQAIAASYALNDPLNPGKAVEVGNFGTRDTATSRKLIMKLVRPKNLVPQYATAWKMLLKNRYPLGGRGIKKEGFELNIEYQPPSGSPLRDVLPENINLLSMFGLDRYLEDGSPGSDKKFDYLGGLTIDEVRGEIVFPTVEPFDTLSIQKFMLARGLDLERSTQIADSFAFGVLYDTTMTGAQSSIRNNFYIRGNITPSIASTYNLGFNIVDGSVEVIVDGQRAVPNLDYTVEYFTGQVVIKNQAFLVPGKNLQIRYEANDLFQLASKSLLAARGDLNLGKNSALGFTVMNLNQQSLSDKVRLGEEPISNTIMGIDGGTTFSASFLTRALNWLPGIQTTAPSQVSVRGEVAYMSPDPNTRKSPISQDNNLGIAYIDDFEGSRRLIPLGVNYVAWRDASPPYYTANLDRYVPNNRLVPTSENFIISGDILPDTTKIQYKAKASWFNVLPSDVLVSDIWGNRRSVARGQEQVTVLNFYYKPDTRGEFNYSMNLENTIQMKSGGDHTKAWAGIQHVLGTTATNLVDENISFIELWVNVVTTQPTVKINLDLGYISEDVIPNKRLDTEDGLNGTIRNGIVNDGEDVGLDGLTNDQERAAFSDFLLKYPQFNGDPSGDDYDNPPIGFVSNLDQYGRVNGTEGNYTKSTNGRLPDTEDLNGNNNLDRINAYYEYEIPLDTNSVFFRQYVTGFGDNGWFQIRIPLNEYARQIGSPTFSNIEGVRLWVTGAQTDVFFRITEFNLVGNQWEELVKNDSTFRVSVVNFEDNPDYVPPAENLRTKDRTRPDENILSNEQSLNLIIKNLQDGQKKEAIKRFPFKPLDVFSYRAMKMFVHGESRPGRTFRYVDTTNYDVEMFFRFGADSLNYYEYRAPVHPGWDPANDIEIRFSDLTAIKLVRDSAGALTRKIPVPNGPSGATYRVKGNPTLTNIRFISIGVENPPPPNTGAAIIDGELWVDELRLTEVDDTPGWAYRIETGIKLADVGNISFSYTDRDPNFHALEERFGTRSTGRNWNLSANIFLEKFLPDNWSGTSLGFSYSHVEAVQKPKYLPGTDILVEEAARRVDLDTSTTRRGPDADGEAVRLRSQTLSVTETYALPNIKLAIPSSSWVLNETINRMNFGYSYSVTRQRSPTIQSSEAWGWNARFGYGLQFGLENYVQPFSGLGGFFLFSPWKALRLSFTPKQISVAATLSRSQSRDRARNQVTQNPTVRSLAATRSMNLSWQLTEGGLLNLGTDYQVDVQSSLVHLELDKFGNQRSFSEILSDIFFSDRLIDFGIDQQYGQTINFNTRPVVPRILMLDRIFTPGLRYSSRYNWNNNIQAGDLGKSAGREASTNLTLDVNLKAIADEIWSPSSPSVAPSPADTTKTAFNPLAQLDQITRLLFKYTLFDFQKFSFTYAHGNRAQNSGVLGGPGFANIFARVPFFQSSLPENGPSLLYQLGFSSDPHGDVVLQTKGSFPFISGYTVPGLRAPRGNLTDVFSQSNQLQMRTSRALWEGATLELNWRIAWSYNENKTIITDTLGVPSEQSRVVSGDVDRSFLTLPPVFVFQMFKTSIEEVNKRFEALKANGADTRTDDVKLSQAFEEGLEALPVVTKVLGKLAPRVNWAIRWDGLEKFSLFKSFASRVSLDHSYNSNYRRRWRLSPAGTEVTESQAVTYGFAPLVGVNMTFKEFVKGNFGASFRYSTNTSYDLSPTVQAISEGTTNDIAVTANYNRQGFEIPFFGLSLSNDLDVSFSYTYSKNVRKLYEMKTNFTKEGTPQEGSSRTILEPRIRYTLSARVTASLYYRYTKISPEEGGSKITGSTMNEGGLDVHVAIQ